MILPRLLAGPRFPLLVPLLALVLPADAVPRRSRDPLPILQRVELKFSVVTHPNHIPTRISFYDQQGDPRGNLRYAVPHLVCDPLVTLYNPHPETVTLPQLRVRIWDPPVGFRFRKNGIYLRPEFEQGEYHGLARLQIQNERNPNARKTFTLMLRDLGSSGPPRLPIVLAPGETRLFAPWVEDTWTWGLETAQPYSPHCFFDWNTANDFTNRDRRTLNDFGVESPSRPGFPGSWDPRAGFQVDHLSYSQRPTATLYDFELQSGFAYGAVTIRLTDTFGVEARAVPQVNSSSLPDFRISLLAGDILDPERDVCQDFAFDFDDLVQRSGRDAVERTFRVGDLLQTASDPTPGGKTPFASLSAIARTSSLVDGSLEADGSFDGGAHYDLLFDQQHDFFAFQTLPLDPLPEVATPTILSSRREGDLLRVAFVAPYSAGPWQVRGGSSPGMLNDDLSDRSSVVDGPFEHYGSKLHLATIDVSELGPQYFLRCEETAAAAAE